MVGGMPFCFALSDWSKFTQLLSINDFVLGRDESSESGTKMAPSFAANLAAAN
jgi:hypothetical protein